MQKRQYVRALPSPEKVAEVRALAKAGAPVDDIVVLVFGPQEPCSSTAAKAVLGIINDPHGYDTDVDEVAVARALQGDREVWESLTHYERREVMIQIHDRRELEALENEADREGYDPQVWCKQKGWQYVAPIERIPDWLERIAEATGWTARRLGMEAKDFAMARVL